MVCAWSLRMKLLEKYSAAEAHTLRLDCCIPVKLKLPDVSVVADLPVSLPSTTDTVASEMGTRVLLAMTCPLRVNVVSVVGLPAGFLRPNLAIARDGARMRTDFVHSAALWP